MHLSLQDPVTEDIGKSTQSVSPLSTSSGKSSQIHHSNVSHSTSQSQLSDDDTILSPSHIILSTSHAASVSRTLTLHLYLSATDSNSSQHSPTLLDSHGHNITALKMELYTLPSKHKSVGHVYLYPNSTVKDR